MSLSLSEAQLLGNWFETLTYGMYLVTCCFCARTLLCIGPEDRWRRPSEIRWFIFSVGITLFVVATFDVVIGLLHNLQAFAFYTGGGGAAQELSDISGWINMARTVAQVIQMILGDFVLANIQMLYCLLPPLESPNTLFNSIFRGFAMAIMLIKAQASLKHEKTTMNSSDIRPWSETLFCITAVQNALTTGLLIWRIWRVEREIEKLRANTSGKTNNQPFRKVIRVIAESGFAYTLMVFLTFVINVCKSNLIYPFANSTLQATGIAFNVIIMRTSPSRDEQFTVFAANGHSVAENGAPTRLRFRSHITELPADIDDDRHQHL
ncbi:hypothetical protein MVEN_01655100 [Mycena venus]|uniref:Uncharacterized protein n=1 Tax=Mycena venus TaxID=2733690 RepID=A0A8H6XPS0_9AGAR|nr:hypothetical protein MVEN_01655100 [Mycena venus]